MRIKMKVALSGTRDGAAWPPIGGETDLPEQEAADLCAAGMAEPIAEDKVEKAVTPEPEERQSAGLTTEDAPVKRQGRPRKDSSTE